LEKAGSFSVDVFPRLEGLFGFRGGFQAGNGIGLEGRAGRDGVAAAWSAAGKGIIAVMMAPLAITLAPWRPYWASTPS
jgi:hypothetical protein